jgi:alkylated DNA nucleotide flippase Atl1
MPFEPKSSDGISERQKVLDVVKDMPPDSIITYEQIADTLGRSPERRQPLQAVMRLVMKSLRKHHARDLIVIRNEGYRVLRPLEHETKAIVVRDRGRRRLKEAIEVLHAAPLDDLSPGDRARFIAMGNIMTTMVQRIDFDSRRIDRQESLMAQVQGDVSATDEQIQRVVQALRKHGMLDDDSPESPD